MSEPGSQITLVHVVNAPQSLYSFLGRQTSYMRQQGFQVIAITEPTEQLRRYGQVEGIRVEGVSICRQIAPLRDVVSVWRLWRLLRRIRPHVVHAHSPKAGLVAMIASFLAGTPLRIYHVRGVPAVTATRLKWLLWATEKISCRLAHRVLCVSPSIREVIVRQRICPAVKARAVLHGSGNGVDASQRFDPDRFPASARAALRRQYDIPPEARVVGYVGRIIREKGIVELVEAWTVLREQFPDLHLLVVGPFESRDPVPDSIRRILEQDPRVRLTGSTNDVSPLLAIMDVLAFPSYREGFGMVALEAAAMRVPVVATRIPGCVDSVADGVSGTLVPPQDASALALALSSYLANPALRQQHGAAGRARAARDFRPEDLSHATLAEYRELLRWKQLPEPIAAPRAKAA